MPDPIPSPPWHLRGDAVALLASPFSVRLLVNYAQSPVGPYLEHALATLTLRGPHVFQMSVNLEASMRGGRAIWGFPKTLEPLEWTRAGDRFTFVRAGKPFRVRAWGPSFPLALPFWTAQCKNGTWVLVPGRIRARVRLAFRGAQLALWLGSFSMEIKAPK